MTKLSETELKRERLRRQKRKSKSKRRIDIAKLKMAKNEKLTRKGAVIKTYERKKTLAKQPINKTDWEKAFPIWRLWICSMVISSATYEYNWAILFRVVLKYGKVFRSRHRHSISHHWKRWWRPMSYRLCPSGIPIWNAFWRNAPTVRFVSLEIFATGVFERECAFSSRTFSLVHSRRLVRLAIFSFS